MKTNVAPSNVEAFSRLIACPKARSKPAKKIGPLKPIGRRKSLNLMWIYYRDHRSLLIGNVSEYRELIVANLKTGMAAEQVFSAFLKPVQQPKAVPLSA
jgi:hypothetical protein